MIVFNHFNFNVLDLEKSLAFYKEALGLSPVREKESADGSFKLVYLGDGVSDFTLELTGCGTERSPTTWASASSTWPSTWTSTKRSTPGTRRWAASVLRIRRWEFISSRIRTDTGLRLCRSASKKSGRHC